MWFEKMLLISPSTLNTKEDCTPQFLCFASSDHCIYLMRLLLAPFYRWACWGWKSLNNLLKVSPAIKEEQGWRALVLGVSGQAQILTLLFMAANGGHGICVRHILSVFLVLDCKLREDFLGFWICFVHPWSQTPTTVPGTSGCSVSIHCINEWGRGLFYSHCRWRWRDRAVGWWPAHRHTSQLKTTFALNRSSGFFCFF